MSADAASAATGVHQLNTRWPGSTDHVPAAVADRQRKRDKVHHLVIGRRHMSLRGRSHECGVLDRLIQEVSSGRSGAVVLRGEPGIGKTALLDYAVESASGLTVVRSVGVQSEMELPFAALHQLSAPMLHRLDRLPGPQRDALGTAFGLSAGPAPDRFLVGLAVLGLLAEVAEEGPLVCVIDDAQWLDRASAQALAFVARRLVAESVGVIFAVRAGGEGRDVAGLRELVVEGLGDDDARTLLASVIRRPLDERVRERIVAETRGNPLALLELPLGLAAGEVGGGFLVPGARPLASHIEQSFRRRLDVLPGQTRQLLLVAAAEPVGEPAMLWRAAGRLGGGAGAAAPASEAGLLGVGGRGGVGPSPVSAAGVWGFVIRSCARRSPGRHPCRIARGRTGCWPRRPTRTSIPIAAPGTVRTRWRASTRTSPANWSTRPSGPGRAGAWRRPPRSCSARRS